MILTILIISHKSKGMVSLMKKNKSRASFLNQLKEHFISYAFTLIFGSIITMIILLVTTTPITSEKTKISFEKELKRSVEQILDIKTLIKNFKISYTYSEKIDFELKETVFTYGSFTVGENYYRVIGIFSVKEPSFIEKMISRPNYYECKACYIIDALYPDTLNIYNIESYDFDLDGRKDFIIYLRSQWADATSRGVVIVKRNENQEWSLVALPSSYAILNKYLNDELDGKNDERMNNRYKLFIVDDKKMKLSEKEIFEYLAKSQVYEDDMKVFSKNGIEHIYTVRNGGSFDIFTHPFRDNIDLLVTVFFNEGISTMSDHYCAVICYNLIGDKLKADENWNWGFPMYSQVPTKAREISNEKMYQGGIEAHIMEHIYVGYTEFEKY